MKMSDSITIEYAHVKDCTVCGSGLHLPGSTRFEFDDRRGHVEYLLPEGICAEVNYLNLHFLTLEDEAITFDLFFWDDTHEKRAEFYFNTTPKCEFQLRLAVSLFDMERVNTPRDGGRGTFWIHGDRLEPAAINRLTVSWKRKTRGKAQFELTALEMSNQDIPELTQPQLPFGPVIDVLGQYRLKDWPGKTADETQMSHNLHLALKKSQGSRKEHEFSNWGGDRSVAWETGGFFRTFHDGNRWYLVDPDGHPFFSLGLNNFSPAIASTLDHLQGAYQFIPDDDEFSEAFETTALHYHPDPKHLEYRDLFPGRSRSHLINFMAINMIRAFGKENWRECWSKIAVNAMREIGFNTVANWSDWQLAAARRMPYVRPLDFSEEIALPSLYMHFPDVFHPDFEREADKVATKLAVTADDPALIGYFLDNEPKWLPPSDDPAKGMLLSTPECHSRKELAEFLRGRYQTENGWRKAWETNVGLSAVVSGEWRYPLNKTAEADLELFSGVMVRRLFEVFGRCCRKIDPNHLNLGIRTWRPVPPEWMIPNIVGIDVQSSNIYDRKVNISEIDTLCERLQVPYLIGEFHFGSTDCGIPQGGIVTVANQAARGLAYRTYVESIAACKSCIGTHWYTMYDQSALGRLDGENFNIGFFDVCHREYRELAAAATETHRRIYQVMTGKIAPFDEVVEYQR
jgi:hypothetical protein